MDHLFLTFYNSSDFLTVGETPDTFSRRPLRVY
jgi:hypothetical protein